MVNVLDIIENNITGMRLSLMADAKGETLPKNMRGSEQYCRGKEDSSGKYMYYARARYSHYGK